MHTVLDLHEQPVYIDPRSDGGDMPAGYPTKPTILLPGRKRLALPRTYEGLERWSAVSPDDPSASDVLANTTARVALLTGPTFRMELSPLTDEDLRSDLPNQQFARSVAGTDYLTAVRLDVAETVYGTGRTRLLENALGFGQSFVARHEEVWHTSMEEAAETLARWFEGAPGIALRAEPGQKEWRSAVLLLSGSTSDLPDGQREHLCRVAGLFRVNLQIVDNVQGRRPKVLAGLRSSPPDGLLVMTEKLHDPESFVHAYLTVKPDRPTGLIGSPVDDLEGQVLELCMNLTDFRERSTVPPAVPGKWTEAVSFVDDLSAPHFALTARARKSIAKNPYPDTARMCSHLERLAEVAAAYAGGGFGGLRLEDYAKTEHSLNVALFDSSLKVAKINFDGSLLHPLPHVQVDDGTTPDKCGRIYFAIDDAPRRFVVDHIGLHDYGK